MQIKETIKRHNLTITEIAKRMNIKQPTLTNIIKQDTNIKVSTLKRIADAIGCNISELLNEQPHTHISASDSVININTSNYISNTVCPYCGRKIDVHINISEHTPE